ncbi:hypothetical protein OG874_02005 [Nocardia sp. NBC_00565]|uniref:hypothetical protein n=1 Tax=Nocardia sp. NBC_00565 TaxID=2975993 RepID=UPI002E801567|nr:hypothetical protein [Nocardia sp. NBC_00565]WUC04012.1 hypothetical protein OG874_02005 [Nocardia sp. NBC_00565]
MSEEFDATLDFYLERDDEGLVRQLRPSDRNRHTAAQLPQLAAREFLTAHSSVLGIGAHWLTGAGIRDGGDDRQEIELRFDGEKKQFDSTTVAFQQTWRGIPVWRSGTTVTLRLEPARVAGVQNTTWPQIDLDGLTPEALRDNRIGDQAPLNLVGGMLGARTESIEVELVSDTLVVYRYNAARRLRDHIGSDDGNAVPFPFDIPAAPDLDDGLFRLARELIFRIISPRSAAVTWLAIVDAQTGALLYLRPFAADVNGMVFERDPITAGGTTGPDATAAQLNFWRSSVLLPGLTAPASGAAQALTGDNVAVQDFEPFTVAPPTEPTGTDFDYGSRTNDFAAVNAYYHNDRFFRLVAELGFTQATYFDGTTFPMPVDHRGRFLSGDGIELNASCNGNGTGGIANTDYELAHLGDTANPIGLANDWRIVLHELGGHGILYDHVNSANFGFAHSAGDSFAAILSDPDTEATDRFLTFPWVATAINRRHDRAVGAGWAWAGSNDTGGYNTEQILSTTHFRVYRSLGGDSADLNTRRFAARLTAYLMLRAVATLTPPTNPSSVAGWVTALLDADAGDWTSEGMSGGAYGKVIRWAFEQQGLYQPTGAPTPVTTVGDPPAVDVYIDDGRTGEYEFQPVYWNNPNVWNRRSADSAQTHEEPWLLRTNYAYCRVRNRGTQTASGVRVKAYHCRPGAGLVWPNDWQAMTTAELTAVDIAPGDEVTVGPFAWTPSQPDHECILMITSATGDPSNVDAFGAGESIPDWRLVPHDNNIGQRNVHPIPAADGIRGIMRVLDGRSFTIGNPFDKRVGIGLDITLPRILSTKRWKIGVSTPGGTSFSLAAGEKHRVRLTATPGAEIDPSEIKATADRDIVVSVKADGILIGGMSYRLDPDRAEPMPQDGTPDHCDCSDQPGGCQHAAKGLLRCLHLPYDQVTSVRVRRIGVDIDLDNCP